jgi:acyl-coenzyme A thioesterase PaaI-like protein
MLGAMLDLVMSFSALCTMGGPGYVVPTINMTTHFLLPARPGRRGGEGATVKKGRTVTFMEGRLFDAKGTLLTTGTASGTLMKWPPAPKPG